MRALEGRALVRGLRSKVSMCPGTRSVLGLGVRSITRNASRDTRVPRNQCLFLGSGPAG